MDENIKNILDNLGININIDSSSANVVGLASCISYTQDETSNILQISVDPSITKEDVKAKLIKPGTLRVEWPKIDNSEDIPVE